MESDSRRSPGMMGGPGWSLAEPGDPSSPPGSLIPVINSTTQAEPACPASRCPLISPVLCPFISSSLSLDSSPASLFSHVWLFPTFSARFPSWCPPRKRRWNVNLKCYTCTLCLKQKKHLSGRNNSFKWILTRYEKLSRHVFSYKHKSDLVFFYNSMETTVWEWKSRDKKI